MFGNGRTALKASFSRYALQEGSRFPETLNPNALSGDYRNWTGSNGDGIPQAGELTAPTSFFGGASGISLDPNISRRYPTRSLPASSISWGATWRSPERLITGGTRICSRS